jgi:hypothetical protein
MTGFVGGIVLLGGYTIVRMSRVHHAGNRLWKEIVAKKLGFYVPEDGSFPFRLVIHARRRMSFFDMRMPVDLGLFADADGGLMFVGGRGTRLAIPLGDITGVGLERLVMLPPRRALRVNLKNGGTIFFSFFEGETFAANVELATAARDRIAARLGKE